MRRMKTDAVILGKPTHRKSGRVMPWLVLCCLCGVLAGCGQKGPLYLPAPAAPAEQPVTPAASTTGTGTSTR